ncbi:MAG: hypothetical protein WKF34_10140 [Pyrinomonadaceae bacterium]
MCQPIYFLEPDFDLPADEPFDDAVDFPPAFGLAADFADDDAAGLEADLAAVFFAAPADLDLVFEALRPLPLATAFGLLLDAAAFEALPEPEALLAPDALLIDCFAPVVDLAPADFLPPVEDFAEEADFVPEAFFAAGAFADLAEEPFPEEPFEADFPAPDFPAADFPAADFPADADVVRAGAFAPPDFVLLPPTDLIAVPVAPATAP